MSGDNSDAKTSAEDGAFKAAFEARLLEVLNKKAPNLGECPACHEAKVGLDRGIWTPLRMDAKGPKLGGVDFSAPSFPLAVVTCGNCGYARFFNLIIMGVLTKEGEITSEAGDG